MDIYGCGKGVGLTAKDLMTCLYNFKAKSWGLSFFGSKSYAPIFEAV